MVQKTDILNTLKISAAAITAIIIAQYSDLQFSISAGIVAILSLQPTKKETIQTAWGRFLAFIIALLVGFISFKVVGFTLAGYGLYLFIFTFLCIRLRWQNALTLNSVLVSHFLTFQNMKMESILNECAIFVIGAGVGVLTNLHLRKDFDYIETLKKETDEQIKWILYRMSERIVNVEITDDKEVCFQKLKESMGKAKNIAQLNYNNQLSEGDRFDIEYLEMREEQCRILYEMHKIVYKLKTTPFTAQKVSELLKEIALEFHQNNNGIVLWKKFRGIDEYMLKMPLPESRMEFEDRAKLFILLRNLEEFIELKIRFADKYFNIGKGHL